MNFGSQVASNWKWGATHPYPLSVNSAFHFIARLRRRRSANGNWPNFARPCKVNRANNLPQKSWGRSSRNRWGQKNFYYICSFFRRLRDLMAIGQKCWKVRRVFYVVPKFHERWSTNGLKPDRSFYPPSRGLFCSVPVHRTPFMRH